jgi:hypothetical protein
LRHRDSDARCPSGEPCRGKFRRVVTTATRPLPIQPSGKLLNQTPFILEETNFEPRTPKLTCVVKRPSVHHVTVQRLVRPFLCLLLRFTRHYAVMVGGQIDVRIHEAKSNLHGPVSTLFRLSGFHGASIGRNNMVYTIHHILIAASWHLWNGPVS